MTSIAEGRDYEDNDMLKRAFEKADTNGNAYIDQGEFADALKNLGISLPRQLLVKTFDDYDEDGDDRLNFDEYKNCVQDLAPNYGEGTGQSPHLERERSRPSASGARLARPMLFDNESRQVNGQSRSNSNLNSPRPDMRQDTEISVGEEKVSETQGLITGTSTPDEDLQKPFCGCCCMGELTEDQIERNRALESNKKLWYYLQLKGQKVTDYHWVKHGPMLLDKMIDRSDQRDADGNMVQVINEETWVWSPDILDKQGKPRAKWESLKQHKSVYARLRSENRRYWGPHPMNHKVMIYSNSASKWCRGFIKQVLDGQQSKDRLVIIYEVRVGECREKDVPRISPYIQPYREVYNSKELKRMFRDADTSGDKKIDMKEFTAMLDALPAVKGDRKEYKKIFRDIDDDNSGAIDLTEFMKAAKGKYSYLFMDTKMAEAMCSIQKANPGGRVTAKQRAALENTRSQDKVMRKAALKDHKSKVIRRSNTARSTS